MTSAPGVSIYPAVVTDWLTACEAGSGCPGSSKLILIGAALPVPAGYARFSCRVFRRKIIELLHA